MSEAAYYLQQAIYSRLTAALAPVLVFDQVPQEAAFPYVTIGDDTHADLSGSLMRGETHTLTLHIWSRYRGRREILLLMDKIKRELHERRLTLGGDYWNILIRFEFSQTMMDEDGITQHGVMRFRAATQKLG